GIVVDISEDAANFRMIPISGNNDCVTLLLQFNGLALRVMNIWASAIHNLEPARFQRFITLGRDAMRPNNDCTILRNRGFVRAPDAIASKPIYLLRIVDQWPQTHDLLSIGLVKRAICHINDPLDPHTETKTFG